MEVDPDAVGVKAALQHLAKAVNIAFQTDYGENYLEAVYQAAIVPERRDSHHPQGIFRLPGDLVRRAGHAPPLDAAHPRRPRPRLARRPEADHRERPSTIRGLFNLFGRKLDLVAEFEDRVPAYVEQMFDRLEASGIIVGWDRDDWEIWTTTIGLNIRISPKAKDGDAAEVVL